MISKISQIYYLLTYIYKNYNTNFFHEIISRSILPPLVTGIDSNIPEKSSQLIRAAHCGKGN